MAGNLSFKSTLLACVLSLICFSGTDAYGSETASPGGLKWKAVIGNPDRGDIQAELSAAGDEKFKFLTGDRIWWPMAPAIGEDGTVYVGSNDDNLYAINPDGSLQWTYTTVDDVCSSPAIGGSGTIYFGSNDNNVYALNPDGTLKWSFQTGDAVISSPAVGPDGTVYVGSNDNFIYALSSDGTLQWRYHTGDVVISSPAIGRDGTIYAGSFDGYMYALSPNGALVWRYQTEDGVISSPAVACDGTVYFGSYDGNLYALNPDGTLRWNYQTGDIIVSSPVITCNGYIIIGSFDGDVYVISPDGEFDRTLLTGDPVWSTPAIGDDGTTYICSDIVYACSPESYVKWSYPTPGTSPAIGGDGTIYFGSADGCLYAVESGTGHGLAISPWPKFHQGPRNMGRAAAMTILPEDHVAVSFIPATEGAEAFPSEGVILTGDGTGKLAEAPKYLAPWYYIKLGAVTHAKATQDFTVYLEVAGGRPAGDDFLNLYTFRTFQLVEGGERGLESPEIPFRYSSGIAWLPPTATNYMTFSLTPPEQDGEIDYSVIAEFDVKIQRLGENLYMDIDLGGYAGGTANVDSYFSEDNWLYRPGRTPPSNHSLIRSGMIEAVWTDAGGGELTLTVTDVTRGRTLSHTPLIENEGWGFQTVEDFGTAWESNGTYYDEMFLPVEERTVLMLDKLPADRTAEFGIYVNGLLWTIKGSEGVISMPAAGTTFTFTTACGEWNEEMTEFTQLFDPPFPGDRWQIDVTGVTIQEPEPPPPGDVTLSCGPATAAIGSAGMVSISLANESAAISGGQFAIAAEPTGQVIFGEVSATTRTEGFTVSSEESGGAQTILFYSASGETLGTGTGEILTLSFQVSQTALAGDVSLTLSSVRIADENDQPLSATLVNGSISITEGDLSKTCDYSGDGKILINDVIVFLLRARDNPDDPAVDWDGNGSYAINDAILLLLDIMKGTCPEAGALLSAIGNSEPVAVIEGLTPGDIAYIENMMEQMELTPEQEDALRLALYGEVGKAGLPKAFFLGQNSPNPFNPATMISFNLPEGASEQVSLKVFDLRGRLVRTLVDGAREAGTYSVFWDGRDHAGRRVSSGVYLYRMQAGEFIQTRKMVLLK